MKKKIIVIILNIVVIIGATYATTTYLYESTKIEKNNLYSKSIAMNAKETLKGSNSSNVSSIYETRLATLEAKIGNVQELYPVGSIYIGINSTNPSTYFGGTWVSFGTGKTLVGIDSSDELFDLIEETGGSKSVTYTPNGTVGNHTLTVSEIPAHTHGSKTLSGYINFKRFGTSGTGTDLAMGTGGILTKTPTSSSMTLINGGLSSKKDIYYDAVTINATHEHDSVGGSGAHNHEFTGTEASLDIIQPYITVYMWKRTA